MSSIRAAGGSTLHLLEPELLIKTGHVDHADWSYRPVLGWIVRLRYKLAISLLGGIRCQRLLEVGYGSGIFMPELRRYCAALYGIDVHDKAHQVQEALARSGIKAELYSGSVECMIFEDSSFDCIVALSSLEFVTDINAACQEINRVLKPNGLLVVITPGHSKILDTGLKIMTGQSAEKDYGHRRELLMPSLLKHFVLETRLVWPPVIGRIVPVYMGLRFRPAKEPRTSGKS